MKENDLTKFRELIVGTAGAYGQYMSNETIAILFGDLQKFELKEIQDAMYIFRNDVNQKKFPGPGEIKYCLNERRKKPTQIADGEKAVLPEDFFSKIYEILERDSRVNQPIYFKPAKTINDDATDEDMRTWQEILKVEQKAKSVAEIMEKKK